MSVTNTEASGDSAPPAHAATDSWWDTDIENLHKIFAVSVTLSVLGRESGTEASEGGENKSICGSRQSSRFSLSLLVISFKSEEQGLSHSS